MVPAGLPMTIMTRTVIPVLRQGLIRRQRPLDILYRSLDHKLILVAAAAGYGKTSLLVDFAHDTELPVCWLTLDEDDRDPGTFLTGVAASIAQRFPAFGEMTRTALASGTPAEEVVGILINELIARVPEFFVLVLDDYHLADTAEIGRVTGRLLRFLPDHARLILSGRTLPDVDLVHLAAKQEVAALAPEELRFTSGETAAFIKRNCDLPIETADAEKLTQTMAGWVTGIVLATQPVTRHLMPQLQPTRGALDVVYAYLAREVLALQSRHLREFLLQTAILHWMTAEMCDSLLSRSDAADELVALEQRHLFIERVEAGEEVRYRYHPLFREFLLEQLQDGDPGRVGLLRQRAAHLYAQKGEPEEAVRHLLAIGELGEATPLIDSLAPGMFSGGRHSTLLGYFNALGDHAENAPRLLLSVAKVLTDRGDHLQALGILEALLHSPAGCVILAEVQVQQGLIWYRRGEIGSALETLLPLIESGPGGKTEAYALRVIGLCRHRQGRPLQAKEHLLRALAMYEQLGDAFNQSRVLLDLALPLSSLGQMREISRYQSRALEILRLQASPAALALALNNAACNYHHMGQFEVADDCYREAWENAQQSGQRRTEAQILIGRADLLKDTGQPGAALDLYQQSLTLLEPIGESWLQNWARIGLAACHRLADDPRQALGWIQVVAEASDASVEATRLIEGGRILVALGRLDEALKVLIQGRDAWATQRAYPELATAELWLGEAYRRAGDGAATSALERAIQANRQYAEHDIRFVLEARRCPALLAVGEQRSVDPPALHRLRRRVREMNRACAEFARPPAEGAAAPVVKVFAFGEGRVDREGHSISAAEWERATARLLFIFLADRSRSQRSALLGCFWPDVPENKAISRLHSTMYSARKAVGGDWLLYQPDEGSYQVDTSAGVWCDVTEFEENLARAKELPPGAAQAMFLRPAIDLYTGPYLAGVDKEWAQERRYELEAAYLEAIIDLGDCHYAQQDYAQALEWYSRAYEIDNYREDIHRYLMLALDKAGRRAEALRQYELCARILRDELGVEPDQKTRTLLGQIRGH